MRSISFVLAFAAVWLIGSGAAHPQEVTLDAYYWSYEEQVAGNDDFVDEYSDPVFASLGLRHWEVGREWPIPTIVSRGKDLAGIHQRLREVRKVSGYNYCRL